jgi:hypothetical protein
MEDHEEWVCVYCLSKTCLGNCKESTYEREPEGEEE